jgi:16S rRNA (uracil1498-N3)-methyltransferase
MDQRSLPPVRSLPRCFVLGLPDPAPDSFELPAEERDKLRKVLRLSTGDPIAVIPGDGRLLACTLDGHNAVVERVEHPNTEPALFLTLGLALPRPEKLEESIRMATEIGVSRFLIFPGERSVVRWDESKRENRLKRLRIIAREAAEVSYRMHLPTVAFHNSLAKVLELCPDALVMSERESAALMIPAGCRELTLLVGPEGGWAPREVELFVGREVTMGPRVLRVDTAVAATAALALLGPFGPKV